jgi:hypothetical protein
MQLGFYFRKQQLACAICILNQNSAVIVPEPVHLAGTPLKRLEGFKMSRRTILWTQKVLDVECQFWKSYLGIFYYLMLIVY